MDFTLSKPALTKHRRVLKEELVKLKAYIDTCAKVPLTRKLVEFEIKRIRKILSGMDIDDIHEDVDGLLMITEVLTEFKFRDEHSVELFCENLMSERDFLIRRFRLSLPGIIKFIQKVVYHLKHKVSREFMATTSVDQKPASEIEGQGSGSPWQEYDESWNSNENMEMAISNAVETAMILHPQDFNGDHVIEILRQTHPDMVVDEDIRKCIFLKCQEARASGDKDD